MVQAVLTGRLTGSGFSPAWFSSVSSECLCIIGLCKFVHGDVTVYVFFKNFDILYTLSFSKQSLVGLFLDLIGSPLCFSAVTLLGDDDP